MVDVIQPATLIQIYRYMLLTRLLEERLVNLYRQGKIVGGLYRSLGQEATAVASAMALGPGDLLCPLIRNLGSVLVRGATPRQILAQYLARVSSPTRGKEGILHFALPGKGIYAPSAMLGTAVPVLAGMVLADRLLGRDTVAMTYLGDGGTSVGAFHEGLNFAAVQKLPLVIILEFNRWAYSTPYEKQCGALTLADKAPGYGVPALIVDGNDALAVFEAASTAVDFARSGGGPFLVECKTYRLNGHAEHDGQTYVNSEELNQWRERDPLPRLENTLETAGLFSRSEMAALHDGLLKNLDEDVEWAESQPLPDPQEAFLGVYAGEEELLKMREGLFLGGLS